MYIFVCKTFLIFIALSSGACIEGPKNSVEEFGDTSLVYSGCDAIPALRETGAATSSLEFLSSFSRPEDEKKIFSSIGTSNLGHDRSIEHAVRLGRTCMVSVEEKKLDNSKKSGDGDNNNVVIEESLFLTNFQSGERAEIMPADSHIKIVALDVKGNSNILTLAANRSSSSPDRFVLSIQERSLLKNEIVRTKFIDEAADADPVYDSDGQVERFIGYKDEDFYHSEWIFIGQWPPRMLRLSEGSTLISVSQNLALRLIWLSKDFDQEASVTVMPRPSWDQSRLIYPRIAPLVSFDKESGTVFVIVNLTQLNQKAFYTHVNLPNLPLPKCDSWMLLAVEKSGIVQATSLNLQDCREAFPQAIISENGAVVIAQQVVDRVSGRQNGSILRISYDASSKQFMRQSEQEYHFSSYSDSINSLAFLESGKVVFAGTAGYVQVPSGSVVRGGNPIFGVLSFDGTLSYEKSLKLTAGTTHNVAVLVKDRLDGINILSKTDIPLTHDDPNIANRKVELIEVNDESICELEKY